MNNEIKNLIEIAKEELRKFNIELDKYDCDIFYDIEKIDDYSKALEELDKTIDRYFIDKFLSDRNYNYDIESETDDYIIYYIGNGLLGYEIKATGRRLENEIEVEEELEEAQQLKETIQDKVINEYFNKGLVGTEIISVSVKLDDDEMRLFDMIDLDEKFMWTKEENILHISYSEE